jgi:hypothetical protein
MKHIFFKKWVQVTFSRVCSRKVKKKKRGDGLVFVCQRKLFQFYGDGLWWPTHSRSCYPTSDTYAFDAWLTKFGVATFLTSMVQQHSKPTVAGEGRGRRTAFVRYPWESKKIINVGLPRSTNNLLASPRFITKSSTVHSYEDHMGCVSFVHIKDTHTPQTLIAGNFIHTDLSKSCAVVEPWLNSFLITFNKSAP